MPTTRPRVQITIDDELQRALDGVGAHVEVSSRSGLIRELALRGARTLTDEERQREAGREILRRIARGESDYDPSIALEAHAEREARR